VRHRDELDDIQREFREMSGTTVIIYDQTCATEKRRRRKRGTAVDPAKRVVINELVCEGCGDCGVQSNCLSVEPLETEFGRKRTINQSSCNKDMSCLKGFCPSFVTVEGGQLKKKSKSKAATPAEMGPAARPAVPSLVGGGVWGIVVAGVGGTGVITIGQLLGMAAHIEGKGIVTQDAAGLAQKGGATWSHVLIGDTQDDIRTTRVGTAAADLILACDPLVAVNAETMARMREGRTHVALNSHSAPTAAFVRNANWQNPEDACAAEIASRGHRWHGHLRRRCGRHRADGRQHLRQPDDPGLRLAEGLDSAGAGVADARHRAQRRGHREQQDRLRMGPPGGRAASRIAKAREARPGGRVQEARNGRGPGGPPRRVPDGYQNAAYAEQYKPSSARCSRPNRPLGKTALTEAVARYLFKLMAYKDEYEVARLHTDRPSSIKVNGMFEGDYKLNYHLAPPIIAKKNARASCRSRSSAPGC
jgi:indolepyruvate ferredoxin oxidoreductase